MPVATLAVKYAFFALCATGVNLGSQYLSFLVYSGPFALYPAMVAGTGTGLITKYWLDKHYIFYHRTETKKEDAKLFLFYSFFGLFTTALFWGTEIAFDAIWVVPSAKYWGAITGLSVGYISKYLLDKRFVFK